MYHGFLKKMTIVALFACLGGMVYAENRTGKVIAIENASIGYVIKYVYVDSNGDNIIDALFMIGGTSNDNDIRGVVLAGYIKNGSSIVYNFDASKLKEGIFFGEIESIIAVDGIPVTKMFSNR